MHLMDANARHALVHVLSLAPVAPPSLGVPGKELVFRRYLAATESGTHAGLVARFGEDYAKELVSGDPEIDMERIGRPVRRCSTVYLTETGDALRVTPELVEVLFAPDGGERQRRKPEDTPANVAEELPVRWTGRKVRRAEGLRKFAFKRTMQLRHVDEETYNFLYSMAKQLHDADSLMLLAAGPDAKSPLVFAINGHAFRGFLEGRVEGPRYQLLLHLSNMELKKP